MLRFKKALFFGLVMWVFLSFGTILFDFFSIDSCLDAGGSFNYSIFECDMAHNHMKEPYFTARLGRFVGLSVTFAVWSASALLFGIISPKN